MEKVEHCFELKIWNKSACKEFQLEQFSCMPCESSFTHSPTRNSRKKKFAGECSEWLSDYDIISWKSWNILNASNYGNC